MRYRASSIVSTGKLCRWSRLTRWESFTFATQARTVDRPVNTTDPRPRQAADVVQAREQRGGIARPMSRHDVSSWHLSAHSHRGWGNRLFREGFAAPTLGVSAMKQTPSI